MSKEISIMGYTIVVMKLAIIMDSSYITAISKNGPTRHDTKTTNDINTKVREDPITNAHGLASQKLALRSANLLVRGIPYEPYLPHNSYAYVIIHNTHKIRRLLVLNEISIMGYAIVVLKLIIIMDIT